MDMKSVVESLDGWCSLEKAQKLYDIIVQEKIKISVEIGVFGGRSFIPMALAHKKNNYGKIYGIDPWRTEASAEGMDKENLEWWSNLNHDTIYQKFISQLYKKNVEDFSVIYRMKSSIAADNFSDNTIELLHIDGNHGDRVSWGDAELYYPKLKIGSWLVFDDYKSFSNHRVSEYLDNICKYEFDIGQCRFYKKIQENFK